MKETDYMNAAALLEWEKIGTFAGEIGRIAESTSKTAKTTKEKLWAKLLKTCYTFLKRVTDERFKCLEKKQMETAKRRNEHTVIMICSTDKYRMDKEDDREPITVAKADLLTIMELALLGCHSCPQGKYVKDCEYRECMHRCGIPISRETVADGECEFMYDNNLDIILPQGNQEAVDIFAQKFIAKRLHIFSRSDNQALKETKGVKNYEIKEQ